MRDVTLNATGIVPLESFARLRGNVCPENTMNFQNVNPFNVQLNMISGNLLPMTTSESSFSIYWKIYSALVWLLEITQMSILIPGCFLVSKDKALRDGMVGIFITFEVTFIIVRLHMCKKQMQQLIQKFNDILSSKDKLMHNTVKATLKSLDIPLKLCLFIGVASLVFWFSLPYLLIFKKDLFFYVDYRMPVAFGKEPISSDIFMLGSFVVMSSSIYIFTKKVSADTYMIHLILLLTAQYRFIASKLSMIIRSNLSASTNSDYDDCKRNYPDKDQNIEKQIKVLCRHHNAVLYITFILRDLMSLNFILIYVNNVLRFCSIGIMLLVMTSMTPMECILTVAYASGGVVQLYLLCYSVQLLLDAGNEITSKAFHEKWYQHTTSVKRIFMMMIMSNNIEYRLSRFEKFNLSLPAFMAILNQSYSIALLLLKTI